MLQNETTEQNIRRAVEEILKRKEFQQAEDKNPIADMIKKIWESILEWVRQLFQNRQPQRNVRFRPDLFNQNVQTILKILLIAAAAVLLFIVVRLIIRRVYLPGRVKKGLIPKAHDFLENPDLASEKMKSLMEQGRFTEALRFLFIAVLLELHKKKIVHIEKWKTNRIYMREIASSSTELILPMRELSTVFNSCCYGNRTIDEACMKTWFDFYMHERGKDDKENKKVH